MDDTFLRGSPGHTYSVLLRIRRLVIRDRESDRRDRSRAGIEKGRETKAHVSITSATPDRSRVSRDVRTDACFLKFTVVEVAGACLGEAKRERERER